MPSLIQKHAHVKGQRSNHHIFKFQPNPSWAKKRPNRYTSFNKQKKIKAKNIKYALLFSKTKKKETPHFQFLSLFNINYYSIGTGLAVPD